MKYIEEENKKIIMTDFDSFNIEEILECGQCFRFEKIEHMHYIIIANSKVLNIKQTKDKVEFYPCTIDEFEKIWINYFDLNTDYNKIKEQLKNDDIVKRAIEYAEGIRILNQEPFECLISFIISQNNRIPMIKQVIKNISEKYGVKCDEYYLFPTIEQLKKATQEELKLCKTGFRDKYILDAIENLENGNINLQNLYNISSLSAKEELLKIKGVGTKVADCVLLFSLKKNDVFPTDVWVKRVMEYFYFDEKDTPIKQIHSFAKEKWGHLAGYAQQYLFYYARSEKIGTK
ncbi:DNA glycosylase [uncultured Tyzzerella sp.]|uniref:DNA-3-methyladenine glycosylase family protein n=1 Tax=uncultured Tyzzerella sp. TaxID=2321398 RepID=UPI002941E853|nr:DNA glycosylase [uncultured Tyzzerella sp.]